MSTPASQMTELSLMLRLSSQTREKLAQRAAARGKDMASVASDIIEQAVAASANSDERDTTAQRAAAWEAWVSEMRLWGKDHLPPGHIVDDSRESIYEGRGE